MRALVTGGGGFLGSAIVRMLLARGDSVVVLARGEYPELVASGVELQRGDDDEANLEACIPEHDSAPPYQAAPEEHRDLRAGL